MSMTNQFQEIAARIRELREIEGLSLETLAPDLGVSAEEYRKYESGMSDIPISFLLECGNRFGVELSELLTGDSPRLRMYAVTRAGKGQAISRRKEYQYKALAYNMADKKGEPFIVTVAPVPAGTPCASYSHDGQEFNLILEGELRIVISGKEVFLRPGDSIYFNSNQPHGMQAMGDQPAVFLAFVLP